MGRLCLADDSAVMDVTRSDITVITVITVRGEDPLPGDDHTLGPALRKRPSHPHYPGGRGASPEVDPMEDDLQLDHWLAG